MKLKINQRAIKYTSLIVLAATLLVSCGKASSKSMIAAIAKTNTILKDSIVKDSILFSNQSSENTNNDTTYISLMVNMYDAIQKHSQNCVLVIGKYIDGQYIPFEDEQCESLNDIKKTGSLRIFKQNRGFATFQHGVKTGEYNIAGITFESFSCSTLPVGIANLNSLVNLSKNGSKQGYSGGSKKKRIESTFEYFIALNKIPENTNYTKSNNLNFKPDSKLLKTIKDMFFTSYLDSLNIKTINAKDLKLSAHLISDKKDSCIIATYHHDTDSLCISSTHILQIHGNSVVDMLQLNNTNEIDAWGDGYKLFDLLDIDGDGKNEIIFEIGYYESTGFEIYKLVDNQYKLVLSVIPWGC